MNNETIVYEGENAPSINVLTDGETVWLTQAQMCQLFGRERSVITKHIKNALKEGEVSNESNVQNLHIAKSDKPVKFYELVMQLTQPDTRCRICLHERQGVSRYVR